MVFYKLGRYYVCDGFTKTQAFTADEVGPNTEFHKWICHFLRRLREDGVWWNFYVSDEAGYYETLDESRIIDGFRATNALIYALARELDKAMEEEGLDFVLSIGGRDVDIRGMRKRTEGLERSAKRQTTLDDYMNETLDGYGGGPHRPLGTYPAYLLWGWELIAAPGGRGRLG